MSVTVAGEIGSAMIKVFATHDPAKLNLRRSVFQRVGIKNAPDGDIEQ